MIWKSAILLWVAFFLVKYLVRVNISREEQIKMALGGHLKWTPERVVLMIVFFCSDYHEPCNVGMVPIFCVINYK